MKCPQCEEDTIVRQTRHLEDSTIWRRRFCDNGHRFSTHQKPGKAERLKAEYARGK